MFFYHADQLGKRLRVKDGHISKYFSVNRDIRQLQPMYELAVVHVIISYRRINAGNPEAAEFSFSHPSVTIGKFKGPCDSFVGDTKQFAAGTGKALCKSQHSFSPSSQLKTSFNSWHDFYPFNFKNVSIFVSLESMRA